MKTLKMLLFAALAALAGCGGGGSTSASAPVTPAPTVTLSWVSPAGGVTGVAVDLNSVVFALAVTNATASDATKLSFLCNSNAVAFVGAGALTVDGKAMVVSVSPSAGANLAGKTCTISGGIITTGPGGTVTTTVNTSFTFAAAVVTPTCVAPQSWNAGMKSCAYSGSIWIESSNALPVGCVDSTQQCFKDAAKIVASGIVLTGINSRPTAFAFYQNVGPLWREILLYADDGTVVDIVGNTIAGGSSAEIDKVMSIPTGGLVIHQKATGICAVATWDSVAKKLAVAVLPTCPA